MVRASASGAVELRFDSKITSKLVFTASLLNAQHESGSVENKPASLHIVPLAKALSGVYPISEWILKGTDAWAYIPGGMHPPQYFSRKDDNAFITSNIGRNCYAIATKRSMSGDGWQGCKSMLSIGGGGVI